MSGPQMEVATEELLKRLEAMCAELEACPQDMHTTWRLNHKGVLGSYAPVLLFTIRKLQQKVAHQAERLDNQAALLENSEAEYAAELENSEAAYAAEHTQYVLMKARALQAERQAEELSADLEAAQMELEAAQMELEGCQARYTTLNEGTTELLDKIDRLSNELHICRNDLGRCD